MNETLSEVRSQFFQTCAMVCQESADFHERRANECRESVKSFLRRAQQAASRIEVERASRPVQGPEQVT